MISRRRFDGVFRQRSYVSEASVYRLLRAEGLLTSPAFIVMQAAERFTNPTTAVNQLWQTDFTYLKVTGWGWYYLSTVLDDFSRYIVAFNCTTMAAADVTATLDLALQVSGLDQVEVDRRPRLTARKSDQKFWESNGEDTVEVLKLLISQKGAALTTEHRRLITSIADFLADNGVRGAGFLQQELLRQAQVPVPQSRDRRPCPLAAWGPDDTLTVTVPFGDRTSAARRPGFGRNSSTINRAFPSRNRAEVGCG
jgi:hypothetical protein